MHFFKVITKHELLHSLVLDYITDKETYSLGNFQNPEHSQNTLTLDTLFLNKVAVRNTEPHTIWYLAPGAEGSHAPLSASDAQNGG